MTAGPPALHGAIPTLNASALKLRRLRRPVKNSSLASMADGSGTVGLVNACGGWVPAAGAAVNARELFGADRCELCGEALRLTDEVAEMYDPSDPPGQQQSAICHAQCGLDQRDGSGMSLPLIATDPQGRTITVVWRHEADHVLVTIRQGAGTEASVHLEPADARGIAAWLMDAAAAADLSQTASDDWCRTHERSADRVLGGAGAVNVPADFHAYFNVADELDGDLTLDDLDDRWVRMARKAASRLGLIWPPLLAAAEDYALDHPEFVRGVEGW